MSLKTRIITIGLTVFSGFASANIIPAPPQLAASSYILIDAQTGHVIVEKNADEPLPPASLTKMMTAYITESEIKKGSLTLDTPVRISKRAHTAGARGSKMFAREGSEVSVENLLRGVVIQSGNDSSVALAEHIAGDESVFAEMMNLYAQDLGMQNSTFKNASGLPQEGHLSTAKDLSILAQNIIYNHPEFYPIYKEKSFTWEKIKQNNRNGLLYKDPDVDGLKTGHTEEAGYCLVASADKEGVRLISVVMGTSSQKARDEMSLKLLNYGFRFYQTATLYNGNEELHAAKVWKGGQDSLSLGVTEDVKLTLAKGDEENIDAQLIVDSTIIAPINKGDQLGTLKVTNGEDVLAEIPLVALEDIAEAGFFARLWGSVQLFFHNLF